MKLNSIIREALYEETESKMNLFYSTDIFMRRTEAQKDAQKEEEAEPEETEQTEEPEEGGEEEIEDEFGEGVKRYRDNLLNEETFRTKTEGVIPVSYEEARNIKTLPHLLGFINRQVDEKTGKNIINDLVVEIVSTMVTEGPNSEILKELIYKGDKINVTINYGTEKKENSVGFEITKNIDVEEITLTLLMEDKPQQAFSLNSFNSKLNLLQMDLRKE